MFQIKKHVAPLLMVFAFFLSAKPTYAACLPLYSQLLSHYHHQTPLGAGVSSTGGLAAVTASQVESAAPIAIGASAAALGTTLYDSYQESRLNSAIRLIREAQVGQGLYLIKAINKIQRRAPHALKLARVAQLIVIGDQQNLFCQAKDSVYSFGQIMYYVEHNY